MAINKRRPTKSEHYFNKAKVAAERSTCLRRKIGAIIVKDDVEISSGYVGSPRKSTNCIDCKDCIRIKAEIPSGERYELCKSVHAEQNAIINAGRVGVSFLGGEMYISSQKINTMYIRKKESNKIYGPCMICKKLIINAGLKKVHMREEGVGTRTYTIMQLRQLLDDEERRAIANIKLG
jgi:dCMP deaminase